jgi:uncharacterized protein (TIGR03437 family)
MFRREGQAALALALLIPPLLQASDCSRTSVGFPPFTDPFPRAYKGQPVGLYPNGSQPPSSFLSLGVAQAALIRARDASGAPDANGRIVLLSVGLSNTTQEWSAFIPLAMADARRNPRVLPVDGAFGGWTAAMIATQPDQYWPMVDARLSAAGVTGAQVQAVWIKLAESNPTAAFPADAQQLQADLAVVVRQARARFPNLAIAYLSSRVYAGYADSPLNPEPYAYQSGFSVKWLIEQQIDGDASLDVATGKAPWLSWGPYLWADGLKPRFDGLSWSCSEFQADGTHPSAAGAQKVARMLLDFFHTDPTARPWFTVSSFFSYVPRPAAVVNAAGYGSSIATGSIATIFGESLAATTAQATSLPLPHDLGGVRVEVDGVPALLYYVSPTQINFVAPVTMGQSLTVNGLAPTKLQMTFWAPGWFTLDGAPGGPLAAAHLDGTVVSASTPARRGETLQAYGTGLGIINPALLIAVPAPIVKVGTVSAEVSYAGPAPGLPGVTQVNFTVPADAPTGAAVAVVFQLMNNTSNAATIAIAGGG